MTEPILSVEAIDRLIHEPARFVLMAHLSAVEEADFVYLVRQSSLSAGNAGSHLKKLEEAGYLTATKAFTENRPQTMYALTSTGRKALIVYRAAMRDLLDASEG